ncbi:MAG: aldehyde dehydrogenase family protein [Euryarchaeota archaeon]|nr:aldehyde dehydrogenase family protein [Euryarchaeota archaeon]MDE2043637.1 aldehyde dehydrogenase family protein [Thermoplasmata archaeon]
MATPMMAKPEQGSASGPTVWKAFLGGEWRDSSNGATATLIDPSTGEVIGTVPKCTRADAKAAVDAAREAFDKGPWPRMKPKERAAVLQKVAELLVANQEALSLLETRNAGKPIRQSSLFDMGLAAEHMGYFAELATSVRWHQKISQPDYEGTIGTVVKEPMGVCAGITPWNLPILMAVWKAGPALAAGNTCVLKPASLTPLTTLELAKLFEQAGLPKGALSVVTGSGEEVGDTLLTHPGVDKVSFTGSTEVGRTVLAKSSLTVKRTTMELGGKSANIILPDADLEKATDGALFGIFLHCGQLCESGSRLLVPAKEQEKIVARLVEKARRIRIGLTQDYETDLGPLVSDGQRTRVEGYIQYGLDQGAKLSFGGNRPDRPELRKGFYLRPTIFSGVTPDMRIAQDEIFGPVLSVVPYENVDQAVEIANSTIFGLAAAVWSEKEAKATRVAERLRAGTVWINDYHMLSCHAPRGGYKQSGIGRELGENALEDYLETKHFFYGRESPLIPIARALVVPPAAKGGNEQPPAA